MKQNPTSSSEVYKTLLRRHVQLTSGDKIARVLIRRSSVEREWLRWCLKQQPRVIPEQVARDVLGVDNDGDNLSAHFLSDPVAKLASSEIWLPVDAEFFCDMRYSQKDAMLFTFSQVGFDAEDPNHATVYCSWVRGQVRRREKGGLEYFEEYGEWGRGVLNELRHEDNGWVVCSEHSIWIS